MDATDRVTTADREDRILTLPNAVTLVRLGVMPVFVYLLVIHHPPLRYAAAWVLAALGTTDWVDGYLARHLHQVSNLGKILDPVADRLLLLIGAGAIVADGAVPGWVAVIALGREALVAVTSIALALMGARRIDVTWFGKAGTFGLMVAFPLFLVGHSTASWHHAARQVAWVAVVPGMVFGLYALWLYVGPARQALRDGRADRADNGAPPPGAESEGVPVKEESG